MTKPCEVGEEQGPWGQVLTEPCPHLQLVATVTHPKGQGESRGEKTEDTPSRARQTVDKVSLMGALGGSVG